MLEPHLAKCMGEKFKHKITAQFRGISPIWTLSLCARDVGGMWMSPTLGYMWMVLHSQPNCCFVFDLLLSGLFLYLFHTDRSGILYTAEPINIHEACT